MKKILIFSLFAGMLMVCVANARVLVLVDYNYGYQNYSYINRYTDDVRKIDFKQVEVQTVHVLSGVSTREKCLPVWTAIRDAYAASLATGDTLEGVVMVGNLPVAWLWYSAGSYSPNDRYFMDIFSIRTNTCYNSDNDVWSFDAIENVFTGYRSYVDDGGAGDFHIDIWVSRIMANQIRGLRDGLSVMDEYTIINNYFNRLHDRMTLPAKVPPRGFAMGGITEWTQHDAIHKLGMMNLNLRRLFKFDNPENTPGNWLLQLTKGPYGGTTLGAFNGQRYQNIGKNYIAKTYTSLFDWKTGTSPSTSLDTFGYEWAGLFEHSTASTHSFNFVTGILNDINIELNGTFRDQTNGKLWCDNNWLQYNQEYYYTTAYNYNPYYDPNPMNLPNGARYQHALFKAFVPITGLYSIWCHYKPSPANESLVWGKAYSMPPDHNYGTFGGPSYLLKNFSNTIDMRPHSPSDTFGVWETIGQCNFRASDTAVIELRNDEPAFTSGILNADAIRLQPVSGQ